MLTRKGGKSYARSMVIYLTIGLVLLVAIIGGLLIWYKFAPQFKSLITYLILSLSVLVICFIVCRGVFLPIQSGYDIDDKFITIKDGYPNSKKITVKLSEIDKFTITKTKSIFFRGLCTIKIEVSKKTYKLKNIARENAEQIKQKLEG